jgi:hypothetical protein
LETVHKNIQKRAEQEFCLLENNAMRFIEKTTDDPEGHIASIFRVEE